MTPETCSSTKMLLINHEWEVTTFRNTLQMKNIESVLLFVFFQGKCCPKFRTHTLAIQISFRETFNQKENIVVVGCTTGNIFSRLATWHKSNFRWVNELMNQMREKVSRILVSHVLELILTCSNYLTKNAFTIDKPQN